MIASFEKLSTNPKDEAAGAEIFMSAMAVSESVKVLETRLGVDLGI